MAKVDIKAAYRAVAIHPSSYPATGLLWNINGHDTYLVDRRLMFGAKPSPSCFHRISQCIKRCMVRRGYSRIVAYQDDFLVLEDIYDKCNMAWKELISLIQSLGFDINFSKSVAPARKVTFLGIELNSETMEISLPNSKLESLRDYIGEFMGKTRRLKGNCNH